MNDFLLFGLVGFGLALLGVFGYTITTNTIIRDLNREIDILSREVNRLRIDNSYLEKSRRLYKARLEELTSITPDKPANKPYKPDLFKEW